MTIEPHEIDASYSFQATPSAVFEAILDAPTVAPNMSKPGDVIEVITLDGRPHQVGYRAAVRINHGELDLRFIDTVLQYDPPYQLKLERLPEAAFHYDHNERLPPSAWNDFKTDPDVHFRRIYGDTPQPQVYTFTVAPDENQSILSVNLVIPPVRRMTGWGRRRALKRIKTDLTAALAQIALRL